MPVKSDRWIRTMCLEHRMIEPFEPEQVRNGNISFGLSSFGYDIRVAPEFKVFTNVHNLVVDPKSFDARSFVDVNGPECIIPPNSFALARTVEHLKRRFVEEGLQAALQRKRRQRPPREVIFDGAFEARLIALACSPAPEGRRRWTVRLLAEKVVALGLAPQVSPMTVQRLLKKTNCSLT